MMKRRGLDLTEGDHAIFDYLSKNWHKKREQPKIEFRIIKYEA
jgi:hypothetical protein